MKHHAVIQNTPEWDNLRRGKITASHFAEIMSNSPNAFGDPAKRYADRIAIEVTTGVTLDTFQNQYMEDGIEYEPIAILAYEKQTFSTVENGGFMELGRYGASSDGLVDAVGMIEVKVRKYNIHMNFMRTGRIPGVVMHQIMGNLWIYNRQWCDYCSYCKDAPEHHRLKIKRVRRSDSIISGMRKRLKEFEAVVDNALKLLS